MGEIELSLQSWNRFRVWNLGVAPELLGQSHNFTFNESHVRVCLPSMADLPKDEEKWIDGQKISCTTYLNQADGTSIPWLFNIHMIELFIQVQEKVHLPEEMLLRPPKAYDLITKSKSESLDKLADKYRNIALDAFELWIKVMQWKCNEWEIGRPENLGFESGWSTYLIHENVKNRVWSKSKTIYLKRESQVTIEQWNAAENALKNSLMPPIFYQYVFDGAEHLQNGELHRAVIDFAVACESCLRKLVYRHLPKKLSNAFKIHIDETNIRPVIEKFLPEILSAEKKRIFKSINSDLHKLFNDRNQIMHSGQTQDLTVEKCKRYFEVAQKIIEIGDIAN